jgi:hypothetical protein
MSILPRRTTSNDKYMRYLYTTSNPINTLSDTSPPTNGISQFSYLGITSKLLTQSFRNEGTADFNNQKLQYVGDPSISTDAATKNYVDNNLALIKATYINVLNYNAVGDGVTDDTAAITAAITAVNNGQILFFPSGTYLVSSGFTIPKNVTLLGMNLNNKTSTSTTNSHIASPGTTIVVATSFTGILFTLNQSSSVDSIEIFYNGLIASDVTPIGIDYTFHCIGKNTSLSNIQIPYVNKCISIDNTSSCYITNTNFFPLRNGIVNNGVLFINTISFSKSSSIDLVGSNILTFANNNSIGISCISSTQISFKNIEIDNVYIGILVNDASNTTFGIIDNCNISATTCISILNANIKGIIISNCFLQPTLQGILISDTSVLPITLFINNTTITNTGIGFTNGINLTSLSTTTCLIRGMVIQDQTNVGILCSNATSILKLFMYITSGTRISNTTLNVEDLMSNITSFSLNANSNHVFYNTVDVSSNILASVVLKGGMAINKGLLVGTTLGIGSNISIGSNTTTSTGSNSNGVKFNILNTLHNLTNVSSPLSDINTMSIDTVTYNSAITTHILKASTLEIIGPPVAGTNVTLDSKFALNISNGDILLNNTIVNYNTDDVVKITSTIIPLTGVIAPNTLYTVTGLSFTTSRVACVDLNLKCSNGTQEYFQLGFFKDASDSWQLSRHSQFGDTTLQLDDTLFSITSSGQVQVNFGTTSFNMTMTAKWKVCALT